MGPSGYCCGEKFGLNRATVTASAIRILIITLSVLGCHQASAQSAFTRKDSLQGGLSEGRIAFDVRHYDLDLRLDPKSRYLSGSNTIQFKMLRSVSEIQLDLFANMRVDSIVYNGSKLSYRREFHAVFVNAENLPPSDSPYSIRFFYSGMPLEANNAPWDGGFVFESDKVGNPWIGVAVQGTGASLWYPCKDSQADEPDEGAIIKVSVPNGLMNVSNGRFLGKVDMGDGYSRWDWEIRNPINHYNITVNVGDYVHISERFEDLDLDYYVLRDNESRAREHFRQTVPMLDCFKRKFGPYPFASDGFKLVETPYLGMEHQSAIAYGNQYLYGYLGRDRSRTGIGMAFDYIIIHESGHEWFGNSITSRDIADMWIHEAFTTYAESVYVECLEGRERALQYVNGLKGNVRNDRPVVGHYHVNDHGSSDMYDKGALMLHTIRSVFNDDDLWWRCLYDYSIKYRHQQIDYQDVVTFFSGYMQSDLSPIFDQYLKTTQIPVLELRIRGNRLECRWDAIKTFNMPVRITVGGKKTTIRPGSEWAKTAFPVRDLRKVSVDIERYYIEVRKEER